MNDERVRHRFRPLEHVLCDKSIADFIVGDQMVFAEDFYCVELGVAGGEEDVGGVAAGEVVGDMEVYHSFFFLDYLVDGKGAGEWGGMLRGWFGVANEICLVTVVSRKWNRDVRWKINLGSKRRSAYSTGLEEGGLCSM